MRYTIRKLLNLRYFCYHNGPPRFYEVKFQKLPILTIDPSNESLWPEKLTWLFFMVTWCRLRSPDENLEPPENFDNNQKISRKFPECGESPDCRESSASREFWKCPEFQECWELGESQNCREFRDCRYKHLHFKSCPEKRETIVEIHQCIVSVFFFCNV